MYNDDVENYLKPRFERRLEVSAEAYKKLSAFGNNPAVAGFSLSYNGVNNSCIDFTWAALKHASLYTKNMLGISLKNTDGALKPLENIRWIQWIKAPFPNSALNREIWNDMPSRSPLQWFLSDNGRPTVGETRRNA